MNADNQGMRSSRINKPILILPGSQFVSRVFRRFTAVEKMVFTILLTVAGLAAVGLVWNLHSSLLVTVPHHSGSLQEGVIGAPGPINPLLSSSQVDRDMASLIFSGLLKATPDGGYEPDLAENHEVSEDGTVHTFTLREDARFHDGVRVTAFDVQFTIREAQSSTLKSPLQGEWENVAVEVVDPRTVRIILPEPNPTFEESATVGIIPRHIWETVETNQIYLSSHNVEPVGSGPFKVTSFEENESEDTSWGYRYTLESFDQYVHGKPYLTELTFLFYPSQETALTALRADEIESLAGISPRYLQPDVRSSHAILHTPLPRLFSVFFNQNDHEAFTSSAVRDALDIAVDREALLDETLGGFGSTASGPLPEYFERTVFGYEHSEEPDERGDLDRAREILEDAGWEFDEERAVYVNDAFDPETLSFTLAVSTVPDMQRTAEALEERWEELGADVELSIQPINELYQSSIRPRQFDALLHGYSVGRDFDLFPFWHSSQRSDPGLNLALYTNIDVDSTLEKIRAGTEHEERRESYRILREEITSDTPSLFLFSPDFIYLLPSDMENVKMDIVTTPEERFLNIHEWYRDTETVWSFFTNKKE